MIIDPATLAVVGGAGWVSILARNYYTQMTSIAIQRAKDDRDNEQKRISREREQFDIVFQNLLTRVNEEREIIQAALTELRDYIRQGNDLDAEILQELNQLRRERNCYLPTNQWDGGERRSTGSRQ